MTDKSYNGWTNWETWNCNLHFDGSFEEQAQECWNDAEADKTFSREENAALALKDTIEESVGAYAAMGNPVVSGKMDREYHKKYEENYYKKPEVKKRRAELMRKYTNDPELRMKHVARWLTRRAIKSGKIKRMPCEICGLKKVDAHHDDYFKPLEVRFLCRLHHTEHHNNAKAKGAA